jgi:hypothetical protein
MWIPLPNQIHGCQLKRRRGRRRRRRRRRRKGRKRRRNYFEGNEREVWFAQNESSMFICFIRKQSISIPQEYSLRQHFETKHSVFKKKSSREFRKQKVVYLIQALKVQQNITKRKAQQALEVSFDMSCAIMNSELFCLKRF